MDSQRGTGWQSAALGDVVSSAVDGPFGSNLKTEHYVPLPGVRVIRLQNLGNGTFDDSDRAYIDRRHAATLARHAVLPGDLLVASLGDEAHPVARACQYPAECGSAIVKADCFRLRFNPATADPGFVKHILNCPATRGGIAGLSQGVTRDRVNLSALKRFRIVFPDVAEQRRIAEILDTVDDAIRSTERLIAKLGHVKEGLLHDLLTRGIDENGELRDPVRHPEQFTTSSSAQYPNPWTTRPLLEVVSLPSGQVDPRVAPYRDRILVAPDHIEAGTGRLLESRTAAEQGTISGKYEFQAGDVVYSKIRPHLRKAVLAAAGGLCSADMYPLHPGVGVDGRFLLAIILGERFSRFAEAVSMRSGFPKINREELAEFVAPIPPIAEQRRIGTALDGMERRIMSESSELVKLRLLKAGLMDDLLSGRVRVTVDEDAA
jgi:type I restriction enzyme S subunit